VGFGEVVVGIAGADLVLIVFVLVFVGAFGWHGASVARWQGRRRKRADEESPERGMKGDRGKKLTASRPGEHGRDAVFA
jgi:uncharacterized protein HemY